MFPISAVTEAIIPKCKSLTPAPWVRGDISGQKIRMFEKTSINMPDTSITTLLKSRMAHVGKLSAAMGAISWDVMFSTVSSHENSVAEATMIKIRAEIRPVSQQISPKS